MYAYCYVINGLFISWFANQLCQIKILFFSFSKLLLGATSIYLLLPNNNVFISEQQIFSSLIWCMRNIPCWPSFPHPHVFLYHYPTLTTLKRLNKKRKKGRSNKKRRSIQKRVWERECECVWMPLFFCREFRMHRVIFMSTHPQTMKVCLLLRWGLH